MNESRIPVTLEKNGKHVKLFVDEKVIEISKIINPSDRAKAMQDYVSSLSEQGLRRKGAIID